MSEHDIDPITMMCRRCLLTKKELVIAGQPECIPPIVVDLDDPDFDFSVIWHRFRVPGKPPSASTGEADESFTAEAK